MIGQRYFSSIWKVALLAAVIISLNTNSNAGDFSGIWQWEAPISPESEGVVSANLSQEGDDISGNLSVENSEGAVDLDNGMIKNNKIRFSIETLFGDAEIKVNYQGRKVGGWILGTYSAEGYDQVFDWKARRKPVKSKKAKINPVGEWQWNYEWQQAMRIGKLVIEKQGDSFVGHIQYEESEPVPVKEIKVEGNHITVTDHRSWEDNEMKIEYKGIVDADIAVGKIIANFNGSIYEREWKANLQQANVNGRWNLVLTTPNGELPVTLNLKTSEEGELTGNIGNDEWTTQLKEGVILGDNFSYKTTNNEGSMNFETKGTHKNGKISGTVSFEYNGNPVSLKWTGSKN